MRKLYIFGLVALACIVIGLAFAEQMKFTTYYPAPHGVYRQFTTTSKTSLATNPLGLGIGYDSESMVGIGTTDPQAKLEVNDSMILSPRAGEPGDWVNGVAGEFAYSSTKDAFYYYNGSTWVA